LAGAKLECMAVHPPDVRSLLHELHAETSLLVAPTLYVASLVLFVLAGTLAHPLDAVIPSIAAFLLALIVVGLRYYSYPVSVWALVLGGMGVTLLVARTWSSAVWLLCIPVGLAAMLVNVPAGAVSAALCTLLLAFGLGVPASLSGELRTICAIGVWGTVGLTWLTSRPLLTALRWSWSSYEQNRFLLDEARDQRLQIAETLAELAQANLRLTRLNHLADNLRYEAEEARRAKGQFVANVSHELRTPLNLIVGFSEMIMEAPASYGSVPPALLADLAVIQRNAQHLASLVDDVLDLSEIEASRAALSKERVMLAEIIDAAATAVRPLFISKGLALETEVPANLVLLCDRTRIREVLLNLLMNAGRFTEQGGVRVEARQEGEEVVVRVTDTGPGIAPEDQARLFQPFQQLDGSIRRRHGGTGLGLAISRSFVELHGGRITVESEVGCGASFIFWLPQGVPAPMVPSPTRWLQPEWEYEDHLQHRLAPAAQPRRRLLVLESGKFVQRLLGRYLENAEIMAVSSLDEAARELLREPAQALLINHTSVDTALEELRQAGGLPESTPAVICSLPGSMQTTSALGVVDYLIKPVTKETLLASLEKLQPEGKTVLIVDDEPEALRLFRRMLVSAGRGYRVLRAEDGRQALNLLRSERPDVVLLDMVMPQMDGLQFLAAKGADPEVSGIPVVAVTARDPGGRPVTATAVTAARAGGLTMGQLLRCVDSLSQILSVTGPTGDPAPPAERHG
jgi:signal transduction histidine kinase/CheY-like chemotaxis protein